MKYLDIRQWAFFAQLRHNCFQPPFLVLETSVITDDDMLTTRRSRPASYTPPTSVSVASRPPPLTAAKSGEQRDAHLRGATLRTARVLLSTPSILCGRLTILWARSSV